MTKKLLSDESFYQRIFFAGEIFHRRILFADEYFEPMNIFYKMVLDYLVRILLNALDVKFRLLPNRMTENPAETERNEIIFPFFGVLFCFYH